MLLSFYLTSGGCCAIIEASKERKGTIMKKHLIWSNYNLDYEKEREWMEEEIYARNSFIMMAAIM